jgi:outer membrane protein TolC
VERRLDVRVARLDVEAMAKAHGLTHATRFLNLLEVAGVSKRTEDRVAGAVDSARGVGVELQIPLFDLGEARSRQATEAYMRAVNRLIEKAVNVRSEARDAYRRYRTAYDVALHYRTEVLPLRKIISDETLLRYNSMQVDVFTLLTDARQRIAATRAAIETQRDFWLASVDLQATVTGGGSGTSPDMSITAAAEAASAGH